MSMRTWLAVLIVSGCAASGESEQPGTCTLSCGTPRVGAAEYFARSLSPGSEPGAFFCAANFNGAAAQNAQGPLTFRFQVFQQIADFPPLRNETANNNGPDAATGSRLIPKSGVAFEPVLVSGAVAGDKTNSEHLLADGTISPFKYAGVVTPKAEWCTDTCGVATFEIWPLCFQAATNKVTVSLISGPMKPPTPATYVVTSSAQ
jgi:hypothetical protein